MSLISIIATYNGPLSLLYACGSMLYTYSIWQKNTKLYRFMGIPVTLIVIVDSIVIKSVFGVVLQGVVLVTSCIGFFSNKENEEHKIYSLAEANYIPVESMAS